MRCNQLLNSTLSGAVLTCLLCLSLSSCATTQSAESTAEHIEQSNDPNFPTFTPVETKEDSAAVYIYRPLSFQGAFQSLTVSVDQKSPVILRSERYTAFVLTAGVHSIEVRSQSGSGLHLPIMVEPGGQYFVRISPGSGGGVSAEIKEPGEGLKEINTTLYINPERPMPPTTPAGKAQPEIHVAQIPGVTGSTFALGVRPVPLKMGIATPYLHYRSGPGFTERMKGAGTQALDSALGGASLGGIWISGRCYVRGCLVQLALALATATTGAAVGTMTGVVSGSLAGEPDLSPEISLAISEMGIPEMLQERIYSSIKDSPPYRIVPISYPAQFSKADEQALHASLATDSTDILLELSLARLSFVGTDNDGPHYLSGVVKIQTTQLKTKNVRPLTCWFGYSSQGYSGSHTLKEWEADHAQLLGEELREAGRQLANYINKYFMVTNPKECPSARTN